MTDNKLLEQKAKEIRGKTLDIIYAAKKGHLGGAFSVTDILVTLFYDGVLAIDKTNPKWENRDRFILSKGHSCAPLFLILEDIGLIKRSDFFSDGDLLGHPISTIPYIELTTGSMGHGLSVGIGIALAAKLDKKPYQTFVIIGDGECYEGSIWESAIFAAHHKLNNLTVILDRNFQSATDFTENYNKLEPLTDKWLGFGWDVKRINGHSFDELRYVFKSNRSEKPLIIIADTIKGKGVSFMERNVKWHHGVPNEEEYRKAKNEIGA